MLSYPSSFQSSRVSDKQNQNPNIQKIKSNGFYLSNKQKSNVLESGKSKKSQQYLSAYNTMQDLNRNQVSQNSMKTILRQFCSTIEQTQQNTQSQNFKQLVIKYFNKNQLNRKQLIQLCKRNQIYTIENIKQIMQGIQLSQSNKNYQNLKNLLFTNLGQLIIQQLCDCLNRNCNMTNEQQKIIEILIPNNFQEEITDYVIRQYYSIYKQQKLAQSVEIKNLTVQFCKIHRNKIQNRLCSDHFRLQISKALNFRQQKQRISYNALCKCIGEVLTPNQISIVFRHIYALQTHSLMPILDTSKTISFKLLQANLLRQGHSQITEVNLQQKNINFYLQQHHKQILKYQKQQKLYLQQLSKKDKQIEQLNRIIDFIQIQKQQNEKIKNKQMEIQIQACKNKYEKRIEELLSSNKQQVKLTQWYQRELEAIMDSVNKENVIRKYLGNGFQN